MGYLIYFGVGLLGLIICLGIVINHLGFLGGLIAFIVTPLTLVFAPWYAALAEGNWFPLMLIYGGGVTATILVRFGGEFYED